MALDETVQECKEKTKKELKAAMKKGKKKTRQVASKIKVAAKKGSNILTRSKPFQKLVEKTFAACDTSKTGEITKSELYVGLLSIHITLARYAGPAATFPPSREVSDELFEAADVDGSDGIDKNEFESIMMILCAQILSRMFVYYTVLLVFVPWFSRKVIDRATFIPNDSYLEFAANLTITLSIFNGVVPVIWNAIDAKSRQKISEQSMTASSSLTTTETEKSDTDKKDE